mmetsp:Transcript_29057/g.34541  ORF Transcript_29057/g.34541 Transcript_29057/m.34541 type:complete len:133 (+) Transcript_29057:268-666(+)|eukprot:CAMPEP_0198252304 /NCGR_PEP_ID=MMETSP1447-20131203/2813_1 /TAXON_ID=420782 /ORGANISM="Chaetoceros dichaeta, Strain CCMP1751" /LENGTH=132 /DNA_ID=CAMNT_0043937493 /DNA_START=244 /DNA_END=642 /DNA_ORIENTATION=+
METILRRVILRRRASKVVKDCHSNDGSELAQHLDENRLSNRVKPKCLRLSSCYDTTNQTIPNPPQMILSTDFDTDISVISSGDCHVSLNGSAQSGDSGLSGLSMDEDMDIRVNGEDGDSISMSDEEGKKRLV